MKKYIFYFAIAVTFLSSCVDASFYEENKSINNAAWTYDNKPSFQVKIDDNKAKYDVYINVRHNNAYDFSNIFVLLHEKGNKLQDTAFRKEIKLAELDGKWLGKSSGSIYELDYLAKENYSFPDTGTYSFEIEQNMRINPLKDVVSVGFKVVKK